MDIPVFANEAEEAAWWPTQEDVIGAEFEAAAKKGTLKWGGMKRKVGPPTPAPAFSTSIRFDPADIVLAKQQAAQKGLRYQTYLKMLLHEALRKVTT